MIGNERRDPGGQGAIVMKLSTLTVAVALCLVGVTDVAAADCASSLTATRVSPPRALPPACRAMGPFRLGMSFTQMLAAVGRPDATANPAMGYRDAVYVFPRNLSAKLARHPVPQRDVHFGDVSVVFHDGEAVAVEAFVPPPVRFPYSVGGIAMGEPVGALLAQAKPSPAWNASRDYVGLYPYPMGVDVGVDGRIIGIDIATNRHPAPAGRATHIYWVIDPTTGLVRGYHVNLDP